MLTLVLGSSGSGKTVYAQRAACAAAQENRDVVMLVPEQFTYETEKELLRRAGARGSLHIEVLSFTRLAQRVMQTCGGLAARYVDENGKLLLMRLALTQLQDRLQVYGGQADNPAFAKTMLDSAAQYKIRGATAELFEKTAGTLGDELLRHKLQDVSLILRAYDALLQSEFADPLDDLDRLSRRLAECPYFSEKLTVIDAFNGFTLPEKRVLSEILTQSSEVVVTLCAVKLDRSGDETGLFSLVSKTAGELVQLANKKGVPVRTPVVLGASRRFAGGDLQYLEANVFRAGSASSAEVPPDIKIACAEDIYAEAQYVARTIVSLARERSCRYRDITVITGDLSQYRGILEPAFQKYGVPLFFDNRRPVDTHPLMICVLSLLEIARGNFRPEPVFRWLKTGLSEFTVEEVSQLENYVLTWNIRGRGGWETEWAGHPDGYGVEMDAAARKQLAAVNGIRRRLMEPLARFAQALAGAGTCAAIAREMFEFLTRGGVPQKIDSLCEQLIAEGELALADEYARIWEVFLSLLDQMTMIYRERAVSLQEFAAAFELVVSRYELRQIPASLDEVTAGTAGLIRAGRPEYVFVIGLADGIFPKGESPFSIFSQSERGRLQQQGLELMEDAQERALEERFFAYRAFTAPSKGLFVSYPSSDAVGKVMRPSVFLSALRSLFPACPTEIVSESSPDGLQNEASAFELLALEFRSGSPLNRALRQWFSRRPQYEQKLESLRRAADRAPFRISRAPVARQLYGEQMGLSPSRVETHRLCRFQYFCRYGLRAFPRRRAELAAPEIGTLIHFVLEKLLSRHKGTELPQLSGPGLPNELHGILEEFAERFLGGLADKPVRFRYQLLRLEETALALVQNIAQELAQSEFVPSDFELPIDGEHVKPYTLTLEGGGTLQIYGKVDRVDVMKKRESVWLRVIDYKSGSKTFRLSDVMNGLNLQMLIYLFTLCQNGGPRYAPEGGKVMPAGVLYVPAKRPDIAGSREAAPDEVRLREQTQLRMNGLVCAEPEAAMGMEPGGRGVFIPAKFTVVKDPEGGPDRCRFDASASVAGLARLGRLQKYIDRQLLLMAKSLRAGDIAAVPVSGGGYDPCRYCDYLSVCGHEAQDPVQNLFSFDNEEIRRLLGEEDTDA